MSSQDLKAQLSQLITSVDLSSPNAFKWNETHEWLEEQLALPKGSVRVKSVGDSGDFENRISEGRRAGAGLLVLPLQVAESLDQCLASLPRLVEKRTIGPNEALKTLLILTQDQSDSWMPVVIAGVPDAAATKMLRDVFPEASFHSLAEADSLHRWWQGLAGEYFWMEISEGDHIGSYLHAPQSNESGTPFWGHSLVRELGRGDVVFHYDRKVGAIVGWSLASGVVTSTDIVWASPSGSSSPYLQPGWRTELAQFHAIQPVTLETLRGLQTEIQEVNGQLKALYGDPLYFPFQLRKDGLRAAEGYVTKFPSDLLPLVKELQDAAAEALAARETFLEGFVEDLHQLAQELLLSETWFKEVEKLLLHKGQVIFFGPPGTGKTFVARRLARFFAGQSERVTLVQFHASYSYEDFVEGYRPALINGQAGFELRPGPLRRISEQAAKNPGERFVLVIDEINRGNVAKVFGELYFLLEYRNESMSLLYSNKESSLPDNLWIVGTMNTADRSIALVDAALRRRFYFVGFFPDEIPVAGLLARWLEREKPDLTWVAAVVDLANQRLGDRQVAIGPSHFMRPDLDEEWVEIIWNRSIIPYLQEQFFGQEERLDEFELAALRASISPAGASTKEELIGSNGVADPDEPGTPDTA